MSDLPQFDWVRRFPEGHSITDMEIQEAFLRKKFEPTHCKTPLPLPFRRHCSTPRRASQSRGAALAAFVYLRDPKFLKNVREEKHRRVFAFDHSHDEFKDTARIKRGNLIQVLPMCTRAVG